MKNRQSVVIYIYLLLEIVILTGCASSRIVNPSKLSLMPDVCDRSMKRIDTLNPVTRINTDSLVKTENQLSDYLSKQDILIAYASGSLNTLHSMMSMLNDTLQKQKAFLLSTAGIERNMSVLRSEIDATTAALDCEASRCRQLSSYLANLNSKKATNLTVAAIIAGAATTILPVFVTKQPAQNIVLISGGAISIGLGVLSLNPSGKQINLIATSNMLSDIWYTKKTSALYPAAVWYIMNEPGFTNMEFMSKCLLIRYRWEKFELQIPVSKQTEELFFGSGGLFDQGSLELKAIMLSEVMSSVNSIKKHLDNFDVDFNNMKIRILEKTNW